MPVCAWANDSKLLLLRKADGQSGPDGKGKTDRDLLFDLTVAAQSMSEAALIVETALVRKLAKSLGKAEVDVNVEKPLHAYGGKCSYYFVVLQGLKNRPNRHTKQLIR